MSPEPYYADDVVHALLDPHAPASSPAVQLIQVAMSGFGYNFYDARNQSRANDQLVRERASDVLGEAGAALGKLERAYREHAFGAATREAPLPPPEVMRRIRAIDAARKRCEAIGTALHTAETPSTDAVWFRFRDEATLLYRLVAFDVELAASSARVRDEALALRADTVADDTLLALDGNLSAFEAAFAKRSALLKGG